MFSNMRRRKMKRGRRGGRKETENLFIILLFVRRGNNRNWNFKSSSKLFSVTEIDFNGIGFVEICTFS